MKRRFGPQGPKPVAKTDLFWRHVEKADGCWIWHGATTRFGYGQIKSAQKMEAHSMRLNVISDPEQVLKQTEQAA